MTSTYILIAYLWEIWSILRTSPTSIMTHLSMQFIFLDFSFPFLNFILFVQDEIPPSCIFVISCTTDRQLFSLDCPDTKSSYVYKWQISMILCLVRKPIADWVNGVIIKIAHLHELQKAQQLITRKQESSSFWLVSNFSDTLNLEVSFRKLYI